MDWPDHSIAGHNQGASGPETLIPGRWLGTGRRRRGKSPGPGVRRPGLLESHFPSLSLFPLPQKRMLARGHWQPFLACTGCQSTKRGKDSSPAPCSSSLLSERTLSALATMKGYWTFLMVWGWFSSCSRTSLGGASLFNAPSEGSGHWDGQGAVDSWVRVAGLQRTSRIASIHDLSGRGSSCGFRKDLGPFRPNQVTDTLWVFQIEGLKTGSWLPRCIGEPRGQRGDESNQRSSTVGNCHHPGVEGPGEAVGWAEPRTLGYLVTAGALLGGAQRKSSRCQRPHLGQT